MRQAESAALKAAGLTETGKKSGTFKRELAAVFSQVGLAATYSQGGRVGGGGGIGRWIVIRGASFFAPKEG